MTILELKKNILPLVGKSPKETLDKLKEQPYTLSTLEELWAAVDPDKRHNTQKRVRGALSAFPATDESFTSHIEKYFIDSEGEVSPSRLQLYCRLNPGLKEFIKSQTPGFPDDFTITGRCELLRRGIAEFPKCKTCGGNTSWTNASKMLEYCSVRCQGASKEVQEKRGATNSELYGASGYTQTTIFKVTTKITKLRKYGNEKFTNREKAKNTWLEIYGVDNPLKSELVQQKKDQTMLERYGVLHYTSHVDFKGKFEKHMLKKFGVRHSSQDPGVYNKIKQSLFSVKKYMNTTLDYQGSYELHFLNKINELGLIQEISIPQPFTYTINGLSCVYNPDFLFRGDIIEIKSSWTYDKNGKDKKLREKNEAKWAAVRASGQNIIILKSIQEIDEFVKNLYSRYNI